MDTASRFSQRWSGTWSLRSKRSSTSSSKTRGSDTGSFQKTSTFKRRRRSARKHIKNIFLSLFFPPTPTTDRTTISHHSSPPSLFSLSSGHSTLVSISTSNRKSLGTKATSTTITKHPPWNLSSSAPKPANRNKPYTKTSSQKSLQNSLHDSKFSSVSTSLSSLHLSASAPHSQIKPLTTPQHTQLSRLLKRAARSLAHQEYLSAHFSTNLVYLFTVKEVSILRNKRLNEECKSRMLRTLSRLRDEVGKVFLRKVVFLQRDSKFVRDLRGVLGSTDGIGKVGEMCGGTFEVRIDVAKFKEVAERLKADANVQQELDQDLRRGILKAVFGGRVVGSVADKVAMRRFLMFVESRVVRMGEVGVRFRGGVEEMEGLVGS